MKEKIIEIIGFGMEPERAELKANEIILFFNSRILDALNDKNNVSLTDIIDKIWITI